VSPLNTLGRGYSITYSGKEVVTDYQTVKAGDTICTRLFNGEITSTVNQATALEPFNSPAGKKKK
jgi:exodeoxyribonuclease VII large subunit